MYEASRAFHEAVANGAPQKALLVFADAIFTNDDIDVDAGIEMDDYFNTEEDIAIGQALSNELRFSIFNDARLLNDYTFGEFTATIGARIATGSYTPDGIVTAASGSVQWNGYSTAPYLKRNGTAVAAQPTFPVTAIAIYDGKVYVFGGSGQYKVYATDGSESSGTLNAFMQNKAQGWYGLGVNFDGSILQTWRSGVTETYEFVPLGVFIAKRPNVPDVNRISFTCHDRMTKFDEDLPSAATLGISYPCTFSNLFIKLCNWAGVPYASGTFINSTATITKEPDEFANATCREVMQWLAESAAANLRFNRDGVLVFDWLRSTDTALTETDYAEYNPYWYETPRVNRLVNRNSESGTDKTVGAGDVGYLIQDNPLLKGVT